jgi:hypothetical protein
VVHHGLPLERADQPPAGERRTHRGAHREEARVHQRGGRDRRSRAASLGEDRAGRELRGAGEHERGEEHRGERGQAGLPGEDAERDREEQARHGERRPEPNALAEAFAADERGQCSTK